MDKANFKKIDKENLEDYYDCNVKYGERDLEVDMNFEIKTTEQREIDKILEFINNIPAYDKNNKTYINSDINKSPSMTHDYLSFYIDELEEDIHNIIEVSNDLNINISRLKEKLNLIRVGIYPQADYFATFDYSIDIDDEPCNQLLVLNIYEDGSLHYITWES